MVDQRFLSWTDDPLGGIMIAKNVGVVTRRLLDKLIRGSLIPTTIRMNPATPLADDLIGVRLYRDLLVEYDPLCPIGTVLIAADPL